MTPCNHLNWCPKDKFLMLDMTKGESRKIIYFTILIMDSHNAATFFNCGNAKFILRLIQVSFNTTSPLNVQNMFTCVDKKTQISNFGVCAICCSL